MIIYAQGDMFTAQLNPNTVFLHACNCEGRWGSGIAACFNQKFPWAYRQYKTLCDLHGYGILGHFGISDPGPGPRNKVPKIAYIMTSKSYGANKDSEEEILEATKLALGELVEFAPPEAEIHSPKINAGLFAVPWEKTEALIEEALLHRPDITWTVWEL